MDLQYFIKQNIPNVESREDYKRYCELKKRLKVQDNIISSEQGGEIFNEFLRLKDKLFDEAMGKYINKREREMEKIDDNPASGDNNNQTDGK